MSEPMTPERLCGLCCACMSDLAGELTAEIARLKQERDTLRASQAEEKERAEINWTALERIKEKWATERARVKKLEEALRKIAGPSILSRDGRRAIAQAVLDRHASPNQDDVAEQSRESK